MNPCVLDTTESNNEPVRMEPVRIEPFPEFQTDSIETDDLNRTLDWLDLWNGDSNCEQHQIHLLKRGSQPQPGALVSFPGSGNSWLRMLLMGLSGVFISSVYIGDDSAFQSKGESYQKQYKLACKINR